MPTIDTRPRMHRDAGGNLVPVASVGENGIWFDRVEASPQYALRFHTKGRGPTHTLVPLNQIMDERYSVYLRTVDA